MEYTIKNIDGIDVIYAPIKDMHSCTVQILTKAGSVFETAKTNGISHFLEHMFFKGGERYQTAKKVSQTIDSIGGKFNAFTGKQRAGYYVKTDGQHIPVAIDVLSDMMVNARFPEKELEKERGVILQEMMMYKDAPQKQIYDKWRRYFYGKNSYGRPTLGKKENIQNFNQKDFIKHKEKLYTKNNMILVIAGSIPNQSKISDLINKYFKDLPKGKEKTIPEKPDYKPSKRIKSIQKDTEQNHLIMGAPGYNLQNNNKYKASILSTILGGNMSSRLFQSIRKDKGLCYYIMAKHSANVQDGIFAIKAGLQKDKFDFGLESIYKELDKIATGDISKEEYQNALGYIKGSKRISLESSDDIANFLGNQYLLKGEILDINEIIKNYEKIDLKEVQNIAGKLKKENMYTCYIE